MKVLSLDHLVLNVRDVEASADWSTARAPQAGSDDLCFLADAGPEALQPHLAALGVEVEQGPVTRRGAQGPIRSVYCRDPDGNLVELSTYRRRAKTERLVWTLRLIGPWFSNTDGLGWRFAPHG